MTDREIDRLLALEAEATPGPWFCSFRGDGSGTVRTGEDPDLPALVDDERCPHMRGEVRYEDGLFTAAARSALRPALLEVRRLRQENICDVCCGKGNPGTGKPCVCGGTGMASRQAQGFRESINYLNKLLESAERERDKLRADVQALVEAARAILKYGYVLHTNDKHTGIPPSSPKCETCALAAALGEGAPQWQIER